MSFPVTAGLFDGPKKLLFPSQQRTGLGVISRYVALRFWGLPVLVSTTTIQGRLEPCIRGQIWPKAHAALP